MPRLHDAVDKAIGRWLEAGLPPAAPGQRPGPH